MSAIVHRCNTCGHPDIFHDGGLSCSWGACPSHAPDYGPPEIIPTFDISGETVERVRPPGERLGGGSNSPSLCGCEDCKALAAVS